MPGICQSVLLARKRGRTPSVANNSSGSTRLLWWFATTTSGTPRGMRSRPSTSILRKNT